MEDQQLVMLLPVLGVPIGALMVFLKEKIKSRKQRNKKQ